MIFFKGIPVPYKNLRDEMIKNVTYYGAPLVRTRRKGESSLFSIVII